MTGAGLAGCLFAVAVAAGAQPATQPEDCIARDKASGVEVSHGEKTYRLASEACRDEFLSDPERYSQLYDALLELEREGIPHQPRPTDSLVPS